MRRVKLLFVAMAWLSGAHAAAPDALPLPVPDARPAVLPDLASDGRGNFLLVWQQGRNYFEQQESDIFALRLDAAGRPLGQPFAVCAAKGAQERPQVVFAGGDFIVAWHDMRNGRDWDVYAARVGVDGVLRDPDGFLVAGGPANQASPVLAPGPGGAVVVWQHYGGRYYELYGASIAASGKAGAARALTLRGETLRGGDLAIAGFGDRAILAWKDETKWSREAEGNVTRHFARLRLSAAGPEVQETARSPEVILGRDAGVFASDGSRAALYAGWGLLGRGERMVTAAVFAPDSVAPSENPNPEPLAGRHAALNLHRVITLSKPGSTTDGPVAAAFGQGVFLVAPLQATEGKAALMRILGVRLSPSGKHLDGPDKPLILYETDRPVSNPTLAAGAESFVLVFEQDDGADKQRLLVKSVRW